MIFNKKIDLIPLSFKNLLRSNQFILTLTIYCEIVQFFSLQITLEPI